MTLAAALATVALLMVIAVNQIRHHRQVMTALGKLNHSIAAVQAAIYLGPHERR